MTIKVQCGCGTRYSFEVEPRDGVMPFRVNCPACNADGTEAANQIIARTPAQPRLRMQGAATTAATVAPAPDIPLPPPHKPAVTASMQRLQAEARQTRLFGWCLAVVLLLVLGALGAWAWYSFVGSKPAMAFSMKLPEADSGWRMRFMEGGRILLANADRVIVRDIRAGKDLWTATLPGKPAGDAPAPRVFADKQNIWVCTGDQVVRLDQKTGEIKQTTPITGQFVSFTPAASNLLVVSATDETRRVVLGIDLASGEVSTRNVEVPRAEKRAMPDELPPNVQPTAGVLLAQATEEQKFNKPLDAVSSEFISAGQNLVELRVKLLEPKINWVKSIKPRGPSLITDKLSASTSTAGVEEEVFNDIKRDQTGGVKGIDESRYEIRLRRWLGDKPVEWKGEVTGLPAFFALQTVDLLTAGKNLKVFDKENNKLFETQLSYPIRDEFVTNHTAHLVPAAERAGVLYFFDQGVLTAMTLPAGEVQWRLTSIGISHVQFDDDGMLYVDTTAASPDDIQYSDQIKIESTPPVILKVDPHSGKILWQVQKLGQRCFPTGKFVYTVSANQGGVALAVGLAEAVNAPRPDAPVYFHIHLLEPATGKELWDFYREEAPEEEGFQQNWFILRFGNEVQAWKFLAF
jgi:outer membrane protein assembly factor BamB